MFTGIIEAVGEISSTESKGGDKRLHIDIGKLDMSDVKTGDSIAVSGVCLTAVEFSDSSFVADVSGETLAHTTLGDLTRGDRVNLEKALMPSSRLGGHMVSGHIDGVGEVVSRSREARSIRLELRAPAELTRYIARKGSICVDGISLTVNSVDENCFDLNIVPHTLNHTTMSDFESGRRVNLEVDVIARYLERLISKHGSIEPDSITLELLKRQGYVN
ncbi:MAG: riboflavin synthase [Acidiferrobacterales bacterium]